MEETTITTTPEVTEQTTPELVIENTQPVEQEQTTEEVTTQEPETEADGTVTETEQPKNWEQIAKDNQASFTRVSQELAELKKQIADSKPKYVDEKGKITPEYEQQYRFNLDNQEYLTYDRLSRQLEPERREIVEELLAEAKALYNLNDKTAYLQKMNEIENNFDSRVVKQIALDKKNLENQMQSEFNRLQNEHRQQRANEVAEEVFKVPDVRELTDQSSENYSPEVVGILKQMFDLTGGIDLDMTQKAISSIKSLGVKEYLAKQSVDKQKQTATVPSDSGITTTNTTKLTLDYARSHYAEACKKYGMDEVDKIITKGQ